MANQVQIVQSGIYDTNPITVNVTAGNILLVIHAGSGHGTNSISDSLSTSYTQVAGGIENSNGSTQFCSNYMWWGLISTTGPVTITLTGTFGMGTIDNNVGNSGGQLYIVELLGANTGAPIAFSDTHANGSAAGSISSTFGSTPAGAVLIMSVAMAFINVDEMGATSPVSFLGGSFEGSCVLALQAPTSGSYTIGETNRGGVTTSKMSSIAVVIAAAAVPSIGTVAFVQSAQDTAGSHPWVTGLTVTSGNTLVIALSGTHLGTATFADGLGNTYVPLPPWTGSSSSAMRVFIGKITTGGALTLTRTGTFAIVNSTGFDSGGFLMCAEFSGVADGRLLSIMRNAVSNASVGTQTDVKLWGIAGSMAVVVGAEGWNNVGVWSAVSPATLTRYADYIGSISYSALSADGPSVIQVHSAGTGPLIATAFVLAPTYTPITPPAPGPTIPVISYYNRVRSAA